MSLVERRGAPRYRVDLPCQAITNEGDVAEGRVKDLSLSGMQMQGDTRFVQTLHPNFKRSNWRVPLKVSVRISLPTTHQEVMNISLSCQLVYCNRKADDVYRVGCQYLDIPADVQAALLDHIEHFGVPKHEAD